LLGIHIVHRQYLRISNYQNKKHQSPPFISDDSGTLIIFHRPPLDLSVIQRTGMVEYLWCTYLYSTGESIVVLPVVIVN